MRNSGLSAPSPADAIERARDRHPGASTFTFGDSEALCDVLLALVRAGVKRATCEALAAFTAEGVPIPVVGQRSIALNWDGAPALVIETTEITIRRFCEVDEAFALAEGEDESLEGWRAGHQAYFMRNAGFEETMLLVCERFRLIEDLARQPWALGR